MTGELRAFQSSIKKLITHEDAVKRLEKAFDSFIVVAFSDPNIEVKIAKNIKELNKEIQQLKISTSKSCPQPIYQSIIDAIKAAQSNSVAILFTKASPKHPDLYPTAKNLARDNHLTLITEFFGNCGPNFRDTYNQLRHLAFELGGRSYETSISIEEVSP